MTYQFLAISIAIAGWLCGAAAAQPITSTDLEWNYRTKNSVAQHRLFRNVTIESTIFTSDGAFVISPFEEKKDYLFITSLAIEVSCLVDFNGTSQDAIDKIHQLKGGGSVSMINPFPTLIVENLNALLSAAKGKPGCFARTISCPTELTTLLMFDIPSSGWQPAVFISKMRQMPIDSLRYATNDGDQASQTIGFCALVSSNYNSVIRMGTSRAVTINGEANLLLYWADRPKACFVAAELCNISVIVSRLKFNARITDRLKASSTRGLAELLVGDDGNAPTSFDLAGYSICKLASTRCGN
jgi:hypothetical protein